MLEAAPHDPTQEILPVDRIIGQYLARVDRGETVCREQLLATHPEFRDELQDFFVGYDLVAGLAAGTDGGTARQTAARETSIASQRLTDPTWKDSSAQTVHPTAGTPDPPTLPGPFPTVFGRYRVLKLLGRGAMGEVYLAEDDQLGRRVALKVPRRSVLEQPELVTRFLREARASAGLRHQNICPVYEVGTVGGVHHIAMAYIEGRPLSEIAGSGPLPAWQAAAIVRKVALALDVAHRAGIVHRDLKPANILIDQDGEPIVMDFGLARQVYDHGQSRITQEGMIIGTPSYMSPEQVRSEFDRIGPASDVYGLGVILYQMLTGRLPFDGPLLVMLSDVADDKRRPDPPSKLCRQLPPALDAICLRMLSKSIEQRFGTMQEVAEALTEWANPRSASTMQLRSGSTGQPNPGRGLRGIVAGSLAAVLLVGLGLIEAGGVTNIRGIVIRLLTSQRMLNVATGRETPPVAKTEKPPATTTGVTEQEKHRLHRQAAVWLQTLHPNLLDLVVGNDTHLTVRPGQPLPEEPFRLRQIFLEGPEIDAQRDELAKHVSTHMPGVRFQIVFVRSRTLTPAGLEKLALLPEFSEVEHLFLGFDNMDDGLFAPLAKLPKLRGFEAQRCTEITGKGLRLLHGLPDLFGVTLAGCRLTPEGLDELEQLPGLRMLNIDGVPCSERHVAVLAKLKLKNLYASRTGIDDTLVALLSQCRTLEALSLNVNPITDEGLLEMARLTNLEELDINGTQTTPEGIARLQSALPRCRIRRE